jgi:hypothetical protein
MDHHPIARGQMQFLRSFYEDPAPIDTRWGHHRIFAQAAYPVVRNARLVPIVMAEAQDLARWFPLCWRIGPDDVPSFCAFRSLLDRGRGLPADAALQGDALPLLFQAFPLVVPDAESIARKQILADRVIADQPGDIGAPLLGEDGKFTKAARHRAKLAVSMANALPATEDFSRALAEGGFLKAWPVDLDLGNGQRATFTDLLIVDPGRLNDARLHRALVEAGAEAALLLASHRLSLFRMSALLMAARRDIQKGLDAKAEPQVMVNLP